MWESKKLRANFVDIESCIANIENYATCRV